MGTAIRKLIDLEPSVIRAINIKAKSRGMTFKRYVEQLVCEDANTLTEREGTYSGIRDRKLLSLVGAARDVREKAPGDDRLDYLLSKL